MVIDTAINIYVTYHLVIFTLNRKTQRPKVANGHSREGDVMTRRKPEAIASAKKLIMVVLCSASFELSSIMIYAYSTSLPDNSPLALFINYLCLTNVNFHYTWICMQFKIIQNMTLKRDLVLKKEDVAKDTIKLQVEICDS